MIAFGINNVSNFLLSNYPGGRNAGLTGLQNGVFNKNEGPLNPMLFSTNWTGPAGRMTLTSAGDLTSGSFEYLYVKNGTQVRFATKYNGQFAFISPLYFHDGTSNVRFLYRNAIDHRTRYSMTSNQLGFYKQIPKDLAYPQILNPTITSPGSILILIICTIGVVSCVSAIVVIILNRKVAVVKASRQATINCCTCLMFSYLSASSFSEAPDEMICTLRPIFMSVSLVLVLGNIIAKSFRIYRIFDNAFAFKSSTVNNRNLMIIVIGFLCIVLVIVGLWLILNPPVPTLTPADNLSSFWTCNSSNTGNDLEGRVSIFEILLLIYAGILVTCASVLAYKTRGVDDMFGESKQIMFVSYNIMIAGIICLPAYFLPPTEFFASYYLSIGALLFATTFTLITLFAPKVIAIIKHHQLKKNGRSTQRVNHETYDSTRISLSAIMPKKFNGVDMVLEAHEGILPVRIQRKGIPWLSRWRTKRLVVIRKMGYFILIDRDTMKASSYLFTSCRAVTTNHHDDHIFQVTGINRLEFYFQVEDAMSLDKWIQRFQGTQSTQSTQFTQSTPRTPRVVGSTFQSPRTTLESNKHAEEHDFGNESDVELNLAKKPRHRLTDNHVPKDRGSL
ncbi:7 transmembrane sweet-taste receptor of 3 GCPR-domain-containing protein [Endogone sp. FLAS-F59071]|nr:7 transmembrane sweet-taste receptor of 3 GCPR-domain-containing protein [Endogone sp. FLAS-F59071]|eukprot:RUS17738.1 7 transmembrane sweet-taste receptor of 3 GCPR-domain-containing protein [Endogone sp. FLAS-F59071]